MAQAVRIDENTWRFEDGGVRFFLLTGRERALLIDSGMNAPDARDLAEGLTDLPLSLLNTHADPDHVSGNNAFAECYMHPDEAGNYAGKSSARIVPVRDGDVIDLGDRPLRILENPGHTPGSIAVLDENARVLYGGDAVQDGNIYMFGPFRNLEVYIRSLERLWEMKDRFDRVYPCHGTFPVETGLIERLIGGARQILEGETDGDIISLHGCPIRWIRFPYAGFYCDAEQGQ